MQDDANHNELPDLTQDPLCALDTADKPALAHALRRILDKDDKDEVGLTAGFNSSI